jgi:alcohol dehydrogenase
MKAAVLRALGTPVAIETVSDPVAGSGEVVVGCGRRRVLADANEVLSGARPYPVELPMIPGAGAIGRVLTLGSDATKLAMGDWVFDPTVRARDDALAPDIILRGLIAPGPGPMKLHRHFHDGSWAELVRVPTENVTSQWLVAPEPARDYPCADRACRGRGDDGRPAGACSGARRAPTPGGRSFQRHRSRLRRRCHR